MAIRTDGHSDGMEMDGHSDGMEMNMQSDGMRGQAAKAAVAHRRLAIAGGYTSAVIATQPPASSTGGE